MDVWGLASAVTDAVKKSTAELSDTLRNTEWRSEFDEIRKEIEDDTSGIAKNAKAITEDLNKKTLHALQHVQGSSLIDPSEQGNQDEVEELRDKEDIEPHMKNEISSRMQEMGQKILSSTNGLYGRFSNVLQNDLGMSFKTGKGKSESPAKFEKFSRFNVEIATLQREAATYCNDPEGTLYSEWKDGSFSLEEYEDQISALLDENTYVKENYASLVPGEVGKELFWSRYFFKFHALKEKQAIVMKLAMADDQDADTDQVGWEDDTVEEGSMEEAAGMVPEESQGDSEENIEIHSSASNKNGSSAIEKETLLRKDTSGNDKDTAHEEKEERIAENDDPDIGDENVASPSSNIEHECELEIVTLARDVDCIQIDTSTSQDSTKSKKDSNHGSVASSKSSEGKEDESWTKTGSNLTGDLEEDWGDVADWE